MGSVQVSDTFVQTGDLLNRQLGIVGVSRELKRNAFPNLFESASSIDFKLSVSPSNADSELSELSQIAKLDADDSRQSAAVRTLQKLQAGERVFEVSAYLNVKRRKSGDANCDVEELDKTFAAVHNTVAENGMVCKPLFATGLNGFLCTLPFFSNKVQCSRKFTSSAAASAFPFIKSRNGTSREAFEALQGIQKLSPRKKEEKPDLKILQAQVAAHRQAIDALANSGTLASSVSKLLSFFSFSKQGGRQQAKQSASLLHTLITPSFIDNKPGEIRIDEYHEKMLVAADYPDSMEEGWLTDLVKLNKKFDFAMHVSPHDAAVIETMLTFKLAKMKAEEISARRHLVSQLGQMGQTLDTPDLIRLKAQISDLEATLANIRSGKNKVYDFGLYFVVKDTRARELQLNNETIRRKLNSIKIRPAQLAHRLEQGIKTMLPFCSDKLKSVFKLPTDNVAACFPFTSSFLVLDSDDSVLLGFNKDTRAPIILDLFGERMHNFNSVIVAKSGSGKSTFTKLLISRLVLRGARVYVIDPTRMPGFDFSEYAPVCLASGGEVIGLSPDSECSLNLFDLMGFDLDSKLQSLEIVFSKLLGQMTDDQMRVLRKALRLAYANKKITHDDATTLAREPPKFSDLYDSAKQIAFSASKRKKPSKRSAFVDVVPQDKAPAEWLQSSLEEYVFGSRRYLNKHSNINVQSPFIVFDVSGLPENPGQSDSGVRAAYMYAILSFVNKLMMEEEKMGLKKTRKLLVVDEAWRMLASEAESKYLFNFARVCRKYHLSLVLITQSLLDMQDARVRNAIVQNTDWKLFLRQDTTAIDATADMVKLTQEEKNILTTSDKGEGILLLGGEHIPFKSVFSQEEKALVTTAPKDLIAFEQSLKTLANSKSRKKQSKKEALDELRKLQKKLAGERT
ncbi:DUF87 domain-containing protein [Candidatus Micrarchaeota archaeon]|nr:DUF87 domain-containing protein [Candidatus Micrarchaeota archaeon]